MNKRVDKRFFVDAMPFYWRLRSSLSDTQIVPGCLPFELDYDSNIGLIKQKSTHILRKCLKTIYRESPNIGNIQEGGTWSERYKNDFVGFIQRQSSSATGKRILEIGCGGCLILKDLLNDGYEVVGIDPSPYAHETGNRMGIEVIQDFFPSPHIQGTFDIIYHSDVIEHMEDPVSFLGEVYNKLPDGGMMILAIPDSEISLLNGDISLFLHQHFNYFDRRSLENALIRAGFQSIVIEKAGYGGSLYCSCIKEVAPISNQLVKKSGDTKYRTYVQRALKLSEQIRGDIESIQSNEKRTLGFYAPVRTLPYLGVWKMTTGFRFFDDTIAWHEKYVDGIDIQIENFEDLKKTPVTDLFIMSPTFGDVIEDKVRLHFGNSIHIKKLKDYFNI